MAEGVLTKDTHHTVVRLAPPLVIERAQIDACVNALQRVLQQLEIPARAGAPLREADTVAC